VNFYQYQKVCVQGRIKGGAPEAQPPKIGKNMIFWRKIMIIHTKYQKKFAPPSVIGKNMIFWRKIVVFHTNYQKKFRASLRSAQFF
jgi:predicted transglutaminase-like protease